MKSDKEKRFKDQQDQLLQKIEALKQHKEKLIRKSEQSESSKSEIVHTQLDKEINVIDIELEVMKPTELQQSRNLTEYNNKKPTPSSLIDDHQKSNDNHTEIINLHEQKSSIVEIK